MADREIDLDALLDALSEMHACTEDDDDADVLRDAMLVVRRAQRAASDRAREAVEAIVRYCEGAMCHHCGRLPDDDGDHSCPCPYQDDECPDHPQATARQSQDTAQPRADSREPTNPQLPHTNEPPQPADTTTPLEAHT